MFKRILGYCLVLSVITGMTFQTVSARELKKYSFLENDTLSKYILIGKRLKTRIA